MEDKEKEKDNVEEIFNNMLKRQDEENIKKEEQEQNEKKELNTHKTEIIAPTIAIILGIMAIFDVMWFTAYFGLLFSGLGIYICRKYRNSIRQGIVIYNVIAFAFCFFLGGLWIIMYLGKIM